MANGSNQLVGNRLFPDPNDPWASQAPTPADAAQYTAQAYQQWLDQQRQSGIASGMLDPQTGWPTGNALVDAARQYGNALIGGTSGPGFKVYHGSPHSFDRFDLGKIGTGEGAQAYGHGLYFADNEGVARSYKSAGIGSSGVLYNGQGVLRIPPAEFDALPTVTRQALLRFKDEASVPEGIANAKSAGLPDSIVNEMQRMADAGHVSGLPAGHMYEVQINADPAHFLDWDKPFSEQSPHVQEALTKAGMSEPSLRVQPGKNGTFVVDFADEGERRRNRAMVFNTQAEADAFAGHFGPNATGREILQARLPGRGDPVAASEALRAAGIPGVRYLDGGSRADGSGTSNHVIFDPATIEILRKYGIAGLIGGGAAAGAAQTEQ